MLFSSSILISITAVLRKVFGKYLPGRLFVTLWIIALLRLMIPVRLAVFSKVDFSLNISRQNIEFVENNHKNIQLMTLGIIIWIVGTVIFWSILFIRYYREYIVLAQALPCAEKINTVLKKVIKRNVQIRISDRIITPVTCGIINPQIVLPKNMNYNNSALIQHIIVHEAVHIIWMDNLLKLVSLLVLGVYWFNPFMWMLCYYLSKDIEIACDQNVLTYIGVNEKRAYAVSLYQMAEYYSENFLLFSGFGKNPIVERIDKVMKYKKRKLIFFISVSIIIISAFGVFASEKSSFVDSTAKNNLVVPDNDFYDGTETDSEDVNSVAAEFSDGTENVKLRDKEGDAQSKETGQDKEALDTLSQNNPVAEENSHYNLHRKYREWYPEMTDEEALEIEKLHEYNRNFIKETTGEIVEPPEN